MTERPYVIFTLRRTGGTALMSFLAGVSGFPRLQHEPLNRDRCWGDLTTRFLSDRDEVPLRAALAAHLAPRPNIKHCIELVPMAVTRALIEACAAQGYAFFLLTRRDEVSRLISLALAMATGAWGPVQAAKIYPLLFAGQAQARPVRPETILRQADQDAQALGRTLALLRHRDLAQDWLVFEDIYKGEAPPEAHAIRIARNLGIAIAADDPRLALLREQGGQRSSAIEPLVPGMAELREKLAKTIVT